MSLLKIAINSLLFYVVWIVTIWRVNQGDQLTGFFITLAIVLIYLIPNPNRKNEALFFFLVTLLGTGIDSLWAYTHLIYFSHGYSCPSIAPIWISSLYLLFAYATSTGLVWLQNRPFLASVCGMIGGPLSYLAAFKAGVGEPGEPLHVVMIILGIAWALIMPAVILLHRMIVQQEVFEA